MLCHLYSVFFRVSLVAFSMGCLATLLAPRWDNLIVKHSWKSVPDNWEILGLPPADATIKLHIALQPHREDSLIEALYEVSSPGHPNYGAHLSKEQVSELVKPHPDALELANSWLDYHGVHPSSISTTLGGNWLTLTGISVYKANDLLGASYKLYRHTETNETILRTLDYSLPEALYSLVQTIAPTTHFASPRTLSHALRKHSRKSSAGMGEGESGERLATLSAREIIIDPSTVRWLYNTESYVPGAVRLNRIGIVGYLGEYPSPSDLRMFLTRYRSEAADASYNVIDVNNGGYDPNNPADEADVDVQYSTVIAYPTPVTFYSSGQGESGEGDPFLGWLYYILDQEVIPQTISISYTNYETDYSVGYARALCTLFGQLGARGITVIVASGDWGVGQGNCLVNGEIQFRPTFPASCPWVTSVGGTLRYEPEFSSVLSGGGFSNYFPRPAYQEEAVGTFLQRLGRQNEGFYNPSGRGIPDLSAQGANIVCVVKGKVEIWGGTSFSTPIVAGIISLLNDYQLVKGRPPFGFLNPWLYSIGLTGLSDVKLGSNPGCDTNGFFAIPGWDAATGLGSPDLEHLQELSDLPQPHWPN